MKRKIQILVMLTTFAMMAVLAPGCGSDGSTSTPPSATAASSSTTVVGGTN